jgi:hypothetical protein
MILLCMRFLLSVILFSLVHGASISSVTQVEWSALNSSISGRLFATVPLAEACFESWNNKDVKADSSACSAVQKNYTGAVTQTNNFGIYGWVGDLISVRRR